MKQVKPSSIFKGVRKFYCPVCRMSTFTLHEEHAGYRKKKKQQKQHSHTKAERKMRKKALRKSARLKEEKKIERLSKSVNYYVDGYTTISNPSPEGGGFRICDSTGKLIVHKEILKPGLTNNEAELRAVLEGLRIAKRCEVISTDSMNTLSWVKSGMPKARPDLLEVASECKMLVKDKKIFLIFENRDKNLAGIENEKNKEDFVSKH